MDTWETSQFKEHLLKEAQELERELTHIAKKHSERNDWEAVPTEPDTTVADKNDVADRLEDFGERQSTENTLEVRLKQVKHALSKIEEGTYGICEVSGEPIPIERLRANPAATTKAEFAE